MPQKKNHESTSDLPPGIGKPAGRALESAGYSCLEQLARMQEADLLKLHGMGPKAIRLIRDALAARGLAFADASRAAPQASSTKPGKGSASAPEGVEAFLESLDHPLKQEILALRQIILGADPSIDEGIKWNAPSFRTSEYFATMQLRAKDGVQVIMHLGAKTRDTATTGIGIADPEALLEWLARDRASAKFRDLKDIDAKRSAFASLIREWIKLV